MKKYVKYAVLFVALLALAVAPIAKLYVVEKYVVAPRQNAEAKVLLAKILADPGDEPIAAN